MKKYIAKLKKWTQEEQWCNGKSSIAYRSIGPAGELPNEITFDSLSEFKEILLMHLNSPEEVDLHLTQVNDNNYILVWSTWGNYQYLESWDKNDYLNEYRNNLRPLFTQEITIEFYELKPKAFNEVVFLK